MDVTDEALRALTAVPYLTDVDASLVKMIAARAVRQEYAAGQVVLLEGSPEVAIYIVQRGWLKAVKMSLDGRSRCFRIGVGEAFNAIGVFIESTNPATVVTLEAATVWVIQKEDMLKLLDESPNGARRHSAPRG
ncbi:MAG: cyclic nucleotide-binding domain-containing protein [Chloroflexi bacterium]|uniref:Crp/Fnr family transcriptional regulator n=1 Tax=Candidatus Flexifilum breve TaxID=3140694 RepID=UPI0031366BAC|nr:cyclic nucleotide-binding domain-containing protein [Chloroflexota bacterium]